MLETWAIILVVGVLGALLGFGLDLMLGQAGWALVGASIGLCAGAMLAVARAAPTSRTASAAAHAPASPTAAPTE